MTHQKHQIIIDRNLRAILEAAGDLVTEVEIPDSVDGLSNASRTRQLAFFECIRRVGECVAQIDSIDGKWLAQQFPTIPWRDVKSTRNRLTHKYWDLDYAILHAIATVHLAAMTGPVARYLEEPDPYAPDRTRPTR